MPPLPGPLPLGERAFLTLTFCLVCLAQAFPLIAAVLHSLAPFQVVQIPLYRFSDASFEGFFRGPTEFSLDFTGIDGITHVVAGAIGYMGDQLPVRNIFWAKLLQDVADGVHHFDVLFFVVAADVVGLAYYTFGDDFVEGAGVIFYVEPVADLVAFTVNR